MILEPDSLFGRGARVKSIILSALGSNLALCALGEVRQVFTGPRDLFMDQRLSLCKRLSLTLHGAP